jgi:hypothetical protein
MVTKTLNETFGYDGWCLEVKNTTREEPIKDEQGRYHVSYIATARITHTKSGAYRGTTFQIIDSLVTIFNMKTAENSFIHIHTLSGFQQRGLRSRRCDRQVTGYC